MIKYERRLLTTADTNETEKRIIRQIPNELYLRVSKSKKTGYDYLRKDNIN